MSEKKEQIKNGKNISLDDDKINVINDVSLSKIDEKKEEISTSEDINPILTPDVKIGSALEIPVPVPNLNPTELEANAPVVPIVNETAYIPNPPVGVSFPSVEPIMNQANSQVDSSDASVDLFQGQQSIQTPNSPVNLNDLNVPISKEYNESFNTSYSYNNLSFLSANDVEAFRKMQHDKVDEECNAILAVVAKLDEERRKIETIKNNIFGSAFTDENKNNGMNNPLF